MKACIKCGVKKSLNEFYVHKWMGDGHLNKCKSCAKLDAKQRANILKNNPDYVRKERERGREKYHRLNYKNTQTASQKRKSIEKYKEKFPEKIIAHYKSQYLKPKIKGNHLHHWSYNEQHYKDVIELSVADHAKAHRFMIYDQERKMYRTLEGFLLDTKEAHIKYINSKIKKNK